MEALVAAAIERGEEASLEGRATLAAMKVTLDTFNAQRVRILETIADIDAGKYGKP